MTRPAFLGSLAFFLCTCPLVAEPPTKDVGTVLGVQRAIAAAREHLRSNRAAEAIAVLEAELLNADGSPQFLTLLHDAYTAHVRELQLQKADAFAIESVRRRLKVLEGKAATTDAGPTAPSTSDATARVRAPAPPIPEAPADVAAPPASLGPTPESAADGVTPPPLPPPGAATVDPFQQKLRDQPAATENLSRASEAFAARRYAQAAELFAEAARQKQPFSTAQRDEWAYSRLHGVAMRLNAPSGTAINPAELTGEVEQAMQSGSERLQPFGNQLLAGIRKRQPGGPSRPVESGWQVVETASFRVLHHGQAMATDIGQTAEAARKDMYERWAGTPAAAWTPRCDIYLHATAAGYAQATGKPADHPGHSTVETKGPQVVSRRIDLRLDEPTAIDNTLPSEVTQVVLADLFVDQPLPRWAVVGMSALSESPEGVARYRRAVPPLLRDRKLFAVGPFMDQAKFPDPAIVTAFYAESVSLVSYLVELKGSKAFATFLREAPRRGYARALTSHYGFKDPADLQDKWVKHVLGGE